MLAQSSERSYSIRSQASFLTSATLGVGRDENFNFFRSRIGLGDTNNAQIGSPFDYEKQSELILVGGMPDPSQQKEQFRTQNCRNGETVR